jgi:CheY-like chemotaxis protein
MRFLIIDDDEDDIHLLLHAIKGVDQSIVCYTAQGAKEALEVLSNNQAERPDLIFLDINMPLMNGWQLLDLIKKDPAYRDIPLIMHSTSSIPDEINRSFEMGALCFFTKPSDFNELKSALKIIVTYLGKNLSEEVNHYNKDRSPIMLHCGKVEKMRTFTSPKTILYIDDDPEDQEIVREALQKEDNTITIMGSKNGHEGISYLLHAKRSESLPCLIILDLNMPGINGRTVLHQIKEDNDLSSIPVIIFTVSTLTEDMLLAQKYSTQFVSKPASPQQLKVIAKTFINHCS